MGCIQSSHVNDEEKARASYFTTRSLNISDPSTGNAEIESQLKRDRLLAKNEIKMLLLGAGESGKARIVRPSIYRTLFTTRRQSTVLKQMKLIHQGGFSQVERESYKEIVFSNTTQSMRCVVISLPPVSKSHPFCQKHPPSAPPSQHLTPTTQHTSQRSHTLSPSIHRRGLPS